MGITVSIITVSDRSFAGIRPDLSGPALKESVEKLGWKVVTSRIVPDESDQIRKALLEDISVQVNLILTTGGTGFTPRDVTPEATLSIIEKRTPGLTEKIRIESSLANPNSILSRAEAGICKKSLIINLPGSPKGAVESLSIIASVIPHAITLITSPIEAEQEHAVSKLVD